MQIIHRIDAFFYTLFPQIKDATHIVKVLQNFYAIGTFTPEIQVEDDVITVNIDTTELIKWVSIQTKTIT